MRNQPSFCVFCQLWTMPTRGAETGCAATLSAALVEWMWSPSPEAAFSSCARSTLRRMNVPALNWRPSASKESSEASMGPDAGRNRSVVRAGSARAVILRVENHVGEAAIGLIHADDVAAGGDNRFGGFLFFSGFGVGGGFFLARVGVVAARGGGEADFLFRPVNFDALKLEEIQKAGLRCGAVSVRGINPGGGAFGAGFPERALALEIEVVQELLAVGGHVVHAKKNGALLHVDIVSRGPFDFGERRIGAIPFATGVGRTKRADARVGAAVAESFVKAADGVVVVGDGEKIIGSPAVIEAMRPDAD